MTAADEGFMETASGIKFCLSRPDPGLVRLKDIAYALSRICRFTGHCRRFYSVGQHSIVVAGWLKANGYPPHVQMAGLLHDAAEAYVGDLSTAVKGLISGYKEIEEGVLYAIFQALNLDWPTREVWSAVKTADLAVLAVEAEHLMPSKGSWWGLSPSPLHVHPAENVRSEVYSDDVCAIFLTWFSYLWDAIIADSALEYGEAEE